MDTPMNAKAALLQALVSGPGFGLELLERVAERTDGFIRLYPGSIYPALRKLEREGLIRSYNRKSSRRGGQPRYYELTAEGQSVALDRRRRLIGLLQPVKASPHHAEPHR